MSTSQARKDLFKRYDRNTLDAVCALLVAREGELVEELVGGEEPSGVQKRILELRHVRSLLKEPAVRESDG